MRIARRHLAALLLVALCQVAVTALPVRAEDAKPFITAEALDLTKFLAPPPANDSAQTKAELGEVLTLQVTRTRMPTTAWLAASTIAATSRPAASPAA